MKKQEYQERRRIINMADRLEFKEKLAGIWRWQKDRMEKSQ
mgnify:CR=1 FL=1